MIPLFSLPKLIPLEYCTVECAAEMLNIEKAYIKHWYEVRSISLFHKLEGEQLTFECFGVEGADDENKLKELISKNLTYKHGSIFVHEFRKVRKEGNDHNEETTVIVATITGLVRCEWSVFDQEDYSTRTAYSITPDMLEDDIKFSYMIAHTKIEANMVEDSLGGEIEDRELYITFDGLKAIHDAISEGKLISKIDMTDSMEKALNELEPKDILTGNGGRASKEALALALVALVKRLSKGEPTAISENGNIKAKRVVEFIESTIKKDNVLSKYTNNLSNLERAINDGLKLN